MNELSFQSMFPRSNLAGLFLVWSHVTRRHVGDQAVTFPLKIWEK